MTLTLEEMIEILEGIAREGTNVAARDRRDQDLDGDRASRTRYGPSVQSRP